MAQSTTQSNNVAVKFRGRKEREMAKTAVMPGQVDPKMPPGSMKTPKAAKRQSPGPKHAARMRKRARSAAKRGLISEKAMKSHMGDY